MKKIIFILPVTSMILSAGAFAEAGIGSPGIFVPPPSASSGLGTPAGSGLTTQPGGDINAPNNTNGVNSTTSGAMVVPKVGADPSNLNSKTTVTSSSMSQDSIRSAQSALSSSGYPLVHDGIMGPQTQSAIRQFQERQGLNQTGILDSATLDALDVQTNESKASDTNPEL